MLKLLFLLPLVAASELAGNENYARDSRRLLRGSIEKRNTDTVASFLPEAVSFTIGSKEYVSPTGIEFKSLTLENDWGLDGYDGRNMLVTAVPVEGSVTCDVLGKKLEEYASKDDVWDKAFLQAILLTTKSSYHVEADVSGCLTGWGGSLLIKSGSATSSVTGVDVAKVNSGYIPAGPYYARISSGVRLTEVYRSFRDEQQAFTSGLVPTVNGTFLALSNPLLGLNTLSIPVPSRLYAKYAENPRPLEGRRIAVKDIYDLAGVQTGGGSRAYYNTYPPRTANAYAIQKLIDQGAVVVGRSKTSQYANGESATADWVDQMCPFNPRGDGYQQPSSSSSGSGAAIAAYDWLDYTIGSDTGGSITGPAGVQGVYGLRPSWGAISLEGVIPLQATQDTAGGFSRSAVTGAELAKAWYGDKFKTYQSLPNTLIFPNSSWTFNSTDPVGAVLNNFRKALTDYIKPSAIETSSLEGFWNATGRFEQYGGSSNTYLTGVYATLITWYQWYNFGIHWVSDYASQNQGRVPFISPSPLVRWNYARTNLTEALFNAAATKKQNYKDFISRDVLQTDAQRCTRAIYLTPSTIGQANYRNAYRSPTAVPGGGSYPAQFASIPELIVPVGQVPYLSTITNATEYLPVTVSMLAAIGCDYVLWDIVAALEKSGALKAVTTGRTAFPV